MVQIVNDERVSSVTAPMFVQALAPVAVTRLPASRAAEAVLKSEV